MSSASISAIGLGQLVNWGVLYYAFAVLLQPVQAELGVPAYVVTGAFSLALLVSALLAPTVGWLSDRGHAPTAIVAGGVGAAALLGLWALVPGVLTLYLVWAALGVSMATVLYEPAFAIVTRAHASAERRLRALAIVTVFGGLASTVFLPITAGLVVVIGWRGTVAVLAGLMLASAAVTHVSVRGVARGHKANPSSEAKSDGYTDVGLSRPSMESARTIRVLTVVFGLSSLSSASFIANLVPALGEQGLQPATAALLGGLFGVMQLPGRALLVSQRVSVPGHVLLSTSLALQAVGLATVAAAPWRPLVALGVMTFATGAGLTILARPYLVQAAFPLEHAGFVNGRVARAQQLTRAAGPIAASSAAAWGNHAMVLFAFGVMLAILAWLVRSRLSAVSAAR